MLVLKGDLSERHDSPEVRQSHPDPAEVPGRRGSVQARRLVARIPPRRPLDASEELELDPGLSPCPTLPLVRYSPVCGRDVTVASPIDRAEQRSPGMVAFSSYVERPDGVTFRVGHSGYDYFVGAPRPDGHRLWVRAVAEGQIVFAGTMMAQCRDGHPKEDHRVAVEHCEDARCVVFVFNHLSSVSVVAGEVVDGGDVVGRTGDSGCTIGEHLHMSVYGPYEKGHATGVERGWVDDVSLLDPWWVEDGAGACQIMPPGMLAGSVLHRRVDDVRVLADRASSLGGTPCKRLHHFD